MISADTTKENDVKHLVEETIKTYGKIDILYILKHGLMI